jgi:transcriptional regulator with XRE-family HTH domain
VPLLTPAQAIRIHGLRKDFVAEQMDISPSYLSMLLSGERQWTEPLQQIFAVAVGMREDAISFASMCTLDV